MGKARCSKSLSVEEVTVEYGGIFWHDAEGEQRLPFPLVRQIFGHSPDIEPVRSVTWINSGTHDDDTWIYNTKTDAIVCL